MTIRCWPRAVALALLPALAGSLSAQDSTTATLICLAPAQVEASGNTKEALAAVRETFTAFLTGPSLRAQPLQARLESQVKEEAEQSGCPYLLLTTIKVEHKRGGSGLLGRAAAGAVQQGASEAGVRSGSSAGRIAGQAASSAASRAAFNYSVTIRNKDELTLGYRLETPDGKVLVEKRQKRKATQDGEDLLTPLVQEAAEQIVSAAKGAAR